MPGVPTTRPIGYFSEDVGEMQRGLTAAARTGF